MTDNFEEKFFETYIDNSYLDFLYNEVRRRNKVVLMTYGEKGYLFKRRWSGVKCTHPTIKETENPSPRNRNDDFFSPDLDDEENKDTDMDIVYRCPDCFGVGFTAGYFKKIELWFRYGDMPSEKIDREKYGIELGQTFNSWTLDEPKIHEKDVFVRQNGERYIVNDTGTSEWRGRPLHQKLALEKKDQKDIIYQITDKRISRALNKIGGQEPEEWSEFKLK